MKKLLLIAATLGIAVTSNAQKLALYEEFTGENCGPCASTNPGFDALAITAANASKVLVIKYQVPIPSAGTILYPQAKVYSDARDAYYSITSAPSGKLDGATPSTGAHPASFTQAAIDAAAAMSSPFNITVSATWDATFTNILATINVTATSAYSGLGSVYLRTALVQDVNFCTPPGTNGETEFSHVVRSMYPDATGTSVASTWTSGTTQTYNFTIPVPNYVDKSSKPFIAVWIQSDGDKKIAQAARSTSLPSVTIDASQGCATNAPTCISGSTGTLNHSVTLQNKGTTALTTADIYYKAGTGAYAKYTWTGTIAAGGSSSVAMPAIAITSAGNYVITDSIALSADQNVGNNVATSIVRVISKDAVTLPTTYNFESSYGTGYFTFDFDKSGEIIYYTYAVLSSGISIAHSGNYLGWAQLFNMTNGSTAYLVVPSPSLTTKPLKIEFWEAYAQQTASSNDKLEVVYSTNCGTSWTPLWSKSGTAHATASPSPVGSSYWLPSSSTSSEWQKRSVDISSLPAGSIMALRVTANGGNNLFIDDINIVTGLDVNENTVKVNSIEVYPNPATSVANAKFTVSEKTTVTFEVVDMLGKVVKSVPGKEYQAGNHEISTSVSDLANGVYMMRVITEMGSTIERFSVVK